MSVKLAWLRLRCTYSKYSTCFIRVSLRATYHGVLLLKELPSTTQHVPCGFALCKSLHCFQHWLWLDSHNRITTQKQKHKYFCICMWVLVLERCCRGAVCLWGGSHLHSVIDIDVILWFLLILPSQLVPRSHDILTATHTSFWQQPSERTKDAASGTNPKVGSSSMSWQRPTPPSQRLSSHWTVTANIAPEYRRSPSHKANHHKLSIVSCTLLMMLLPSSWRPTTHVYSTTATSVSSSGLDEWRQHEVQWVIDIRMAVHSHSSGTRYSDSRGNRSWNWSVRVYVCRFMVLDVFVTAMKLVTSSISRCMIRWCFVWQVGEMTRCRGDEEMCVAAPASPTGACQLLERRRHVSVCSLSRMSETSDVSLEDLTRSDDMDITDVSPWYDF